MNAPAMKGENPKFSVLTEVFSQFTEENRDSLLKTAAQLLKMQREDAEVPTDTSLLGEKVEDRPE